MVTVSSAQPSAPQSLFGLSQCGSDSDGFLTVGCMARGFNPADSLSFKWTDPNGQQVNDFLQYPAFGKDGDYTKISHLRVNKSDWDPNKQYKCEATNTAGKKEASVVQAREKLGKAMLTLTLKPPTQRDIFLFNHVTLQAVVSGNDNKAVKDASVSCTMENEEIPSKKGQFHKDISQIIHNVTVNTKNWLDGKTVTCTISDIRQEIKINEGDIPNVVLYEQSIDNNNPTHVSLVCEVSSPKLGDVYIMWKVDGGEYKEAPVTAPIHREDSTSVLSIFKVSKEEYKKSVSCGVVHAKIANYMSPIVKSASGSEPPEPETGFALNCNEDVIEEDEFRSLWSTATSFIFLFLFSLTYGALLSLSKMKQ